MNLSMFWTALKSGETLTDPASWKNKQNLINSLVAVIGVLVWLLSKFGLSLDISGDDLAAIAGGVAVVMGAFNNYLTTATTKKIGIADNIQGE